MKLNRTALNFILSQMKAVSLTHLPKEKTDLTEQHKKVLDAVNLWDSSHRESIVKLASALLDFDLMPHYKTINSLVSGMILVPIKEFDRRYKINQPVIYTHSDLSMNLAGEFHDDLIRPDGVRLRLATSEEIEKFYVDLLEVDTQALQKLIKFVIANWTLEIEK